jgi:general L-amino acid transport system permease protein
VHRWAKRRQELTGQQFPAFWTGLALVVGLPVLVSLVGGSHLTWSLPVLKGFNFAGGMVILPEFVALLLALSIYTGAFIAEIVRGGIQAVSHGQTEAAHAMGLSTVQTTRLVILPQALRIIVPPLTSQFLNLTKNSSLAVAIGYPELVSVFMGTVQNQTGHPVETIAMTMAVYLLISLLISLFMNWYNRRIALVER